MRRTRAAAARADLVLWMMDAIAPMSRRRSLSMKRCRVRARRGGSSSIRSTWMGPGALARLTPSAGDAEAEKQLHISAVTGAGVDALIDAVVGLCHSLLQGGAGARHARAPTRRPRRGGAGTRRCHRACGNGRRWRELVAEELRHAATHLGQLTGRVDVEDVLEVIFREFCVGK